MSKITFRADDDLVRKLEEFDASKSEVMREALREYLGEGGGGAGADGGARTSDAATDEGSLDDLVAARVDELLADRLEGGVGPREPQDVNVNITLEGDAASVSRDRDEERKTPAPDRPEASDESRCCKQCGEALSASDVYCSNCGEKTSHRVFCECGDELRSDWGFCPGCGRRTPAADVLGDS